MRRLLPTVLAFALLSPVAHAAAGADGAIDDVEARRAAAWNAHDAGAVAALFAADGDLITIDGWRWHGREEIAAKLTQAFGFVLAESQVRVRTISVRPLSGDLAVAQVAWSMTGARRADGAGDDDGDTIETQLLRRTQAGGWEIVAAQATRISPERPFATVAAPAPPPPAAAPQPGAEPDTRPCLVANSSGRCLIHKGKPRLQ